MDVRNKKDFYGKKRHCPPVAVQWFSVQLFVIFKFSNCYKISAFRLKSLYFQYQPNSLLLFLSLIVIWQQLRLSWLRVYVGKSRRKLKKNVASRTKKPVVKSSCECRRNLHKITNSHLWNEHHSCPETKWKFLVCNRAFFWVLFYFYGNLMKPSSLLKTTTL